MGRPAAMASKALSGEVWRSVIAVCRNGTATTRRPRQLARHLGLGDVPAHLDAIGEPELVRARSHAAEVGLAGKAAQDDQARVGHPRHRVHQHVHALPGIELPRVEHARRALGGQAGKRPVLGDVAPVRRPRATAACAPRTAR